MKNRLRSDGADGAYSRTPIGGRRFLSYADLELRYGKSRVTIWRWVRAGLLPKPYQTGPNSIGFDAEEVDQRDADLPRRNYG